MSITKNSARQCPVVAHVDINLADLTSGVDLQAIELPLNAVVVDGGITVTEVFNSTTSDVLDVGDATVQNRYLNDATLRTLARVPLVPTGFKAGTAERNITVRWVSGGGTPTTGKLRLDVTYYVVGRAEFSQG